MKKVYIDLETRSSNDLAKVGVHKYCEAGDFTILCASYKEEDKDVVKTVTEIKEGSELDRLLKDENVQIVAHNAEFERICLNTTYGKNWLKPERFNCTQARARVAGEDKLSLAYLADKFGSYKDGEGKDLIKIFCKPQRDGSFISPEDSPSAFDRLIAYCEQDVVALEVIDKNLPELSDREKEIYCATSRMNERGVLIDTDLVAKLKGCYEKLVEGSDVIAKKYNINLNSPKQLVEFFQANGLSTNNARKETLEALLEEDIPARVREVIEAKQLSSSAAIKKLYAITDKLCSDGRLRDELVYYGAQATGRFAGTGVQLQNLKRASVKYDDVMSRIEDGTYNIDDLTSLIRSCICSDTSLAIIDFSAIEMIVAAWFCGDQETFDNYFNEVDLHTAMATKMFNVSTDEVTKSQRQLAKTANFSCLYGGSAVAFSRAQQCKACGDDPCDECRMSVNRWRNANPLLVNKWYELDTQLQFARLADTTQKYIKSDAKGTILCDLINREVPISNPDDYFGGKLLNIFVQGIARDILCDSWLRLEKAGYAPVLTVHDELVIDLALSEDSDFDKITELFQKVETLPGLEYIRSDGGIDTRYSK